ncbi:MAG: fused MFS/spermidine synthase, partial [Candidatus Omnitrophota bacterium]
MINPNRRIIYFLYTVSGFTALTLEIVWARRFSMVFGNTTLAAAAVISATMAGLAFGAWRLGRLCSAFKSAHLLKAYGVLEAVIGLFAISMPLLIRTAEPVYSCVYPALQDRPIALSLIRFGLSLALLVIPATLMGGTFPLLARYMSASKSVFAQDSVNRLYSVNLLGAVAGAFAGGFILLPSMPVWVIEWFAAVLNWTVAIAAILLGLQQPVGDAGAASITFAPTHEQPSSADSPPTLIRSVAFAQGAAALTIQVLWMRLSGLVLGSSVYAFSAVLTTFLAGLWLGSALLTWPRLRRKWTDSQWLVISLLAGGWLTLFYLPVYERTFFYYVRYFEWCEASFSHTIAAQFFLSALPMLLPATLLGMIFPLILRIASGKTHSSAPVGGLYALNCLGGVAGAGFCALWLIPNVGLVRALKITALMLASLGGIFWLLQQRKNDPRIVITKFFLIGFAVIATALYPVDRYVLSSGVFLYADTWRSSVYRGFDKFKQALRRDRQITYYRDGDASTVTAMSYRSKNAAAEAPMSLLINGKTDASSDGDMATQLSMGYLPLLAHPEPKDVLIIGLGSGMTVAAVNEFETVRTVDVAEVEPRVVPACQLFARYNRDALRDKRVHVIFQDGRNHLQYTDRRYDVIISEPSNPWMAGVAQLYTRENYLRASKRLSEGGLYCQWLHSYRMSQRGFVSVLKTFASVFPHVYLFNVQDVDYLLLGSLEPLTFDMERARALIRRRPAVASDLAASGLRDESFIAGSFVLAGSDLRRALAGQPLSELNTDEKLSLGYEAAASMYLSDSEPIRQWLDEAPRSLEQPPMIGWRWPNPDDSSSAAKMDFVALQCEGALRGGRFADAMKLARRYERYN